MRKAQRAITDTAELKDLLRTAEVLHLGLSDGRMPYVVTLNYGYADGAIYFHCAAEGRKADMLRANPQVAFSIVVEHKLVRDAKPCNFTTHFVSLSGDGRATILEEPAEKMAALTAFMAHYDMDTADFPAGMLERTMVVRVAIDRLTGKRNPTPANQ